jgi:hypothetical protein
MKVLDSRRIGMITGSLRPKHTQFCEDNDDLLKSLNRRILLLHQTPSDHGQTDLTQC